MPNADNLAKAREMFKNSFKMIVKSNLIIREEVKEICNPEKTGEKRYLNEWATINIKSCRQSGHSKSSIEVCSEVFDNVLYLAYNQDMANSWRKNCKHCQNVEFLSYRSKTWRGKRFDCVIIDCSSVIKNQDKEMIETCLGPLVVFDKFTMIWVE